MSGRRRGGPVGAAGRVDQDGPHGGHGPPVAVGGGPLGAPGRGHALAVQGVVDRPEDIRRGHYVAVLYVIDQYFPCCFDHAGTDPVDIRWRPRFQVQPLRVIDVCLPFVTALKADSSVITLDVRRYELARLDDAYARRVVKPLRAPRPQRNKHR